MKKIKFLDLESQKDRLNNTIELNIKKVLEHSKYIMGPEVKELELRLQKYTKAKYCVTCASGTDALILSLMSLNIGANDIVICPSFTFPATAEAILITGAKPYFVDVGLDTFNICYKELEKILEKDYKKNKIKAIIAVDLFGLPANYTRLNKISKKYKINIIADGAQSFGGGLNNKKVGSLTKITCTSFFPAKPLGCYGDGGALFTNNKVISEKLVSLRAHGKGKSKYEISEIGLNSRLDSIQASILLAKLKIFNWELKERNKNANLYNKELKKYYHIPEIPKGSSSAWAQYTIRTRNRDKVLNFLNDKSIPTMIYYPIPMHMQPAYRKYNKYKNVLKNSLKLSKTVLSIPIHSFLSNSQKEYIILNLKKAYKLI